MPTCDLSIIVVNYNSNPELRQCLSALERVRGELPFEVLVVDNGSTDGSWPAAQAEHPWCRFQALGENHGFAGACNHGLDAASGRHVLLLNPDTEVQPGALKTLVRDLDQHPAWGIVGPRMVTPPIPPAREGVLYPAARRFPTPWSLFCEITGLARLFPHTKRFNGYLYGERNRKVLSRVDQIEGSALMISAAARRVVGKLDPQFFIFFEEVDWCKRVHDAGFEIHLIQDAVVTHHRSTTMSKFFVPSRVHHAESAMKYFRKHYGTEGLCKLRRWMRVGLWIRTCVLRTLLLVKRSDAFRIRLEGTRTMREVYRRGLPS